MITQTLQAICFPSRGEGPRWYIVIDTRLVDINSSRDTSPETTHCGAKVLLGVDHQSCVHNHVINMDSIRCQTRISSKL